MNKTATILLVEDEKAIANFLTVMLQAHDYHVLEADTGAQAIALAAAHSPQLILLDLGLPDMDGLAVLDEIRAWSLAPVIVVSARDQESIQVEALDRGADDYITKPFRNAELMARIRTALRRPAFAHVEASQGQLRVGGLIIDAQAHTIYVDGREVHLTPVEHRIVWLLACNAGRVFTHERMLKTLWGPHYDNPQILRVNMANIRRKIEHNPADPVYILTEVGVGYRMAELDAGMGR